MISFTYHIEHLHSTGNFTGIIGYQIPDSYFLWSFEKKLDWQIDNFCVPVSIEWIKGWLEVKNNPDFYCNVLYCQHQTLAKNVKKYFQNILSFYGLPEEKFKFPPQPEFKEKTHMRKGETDEWKKILNSNQTKKINNLMPESWFERFDWDK